MFDVSVILFPKGNFFLLESTLHHERRIPDIKSPANTVVSFLLR